MTITPGTIAPQFGAGAVIPTPQGIAAGAGVVPGVTPGTTPPTFAQSSGSVPIPSAADPKSALRNILENLGRMAAQKQIAVKPVLPPVPGQVSGNSPGYMQGPDWGFERFANSVQAQVRNASSAYKERQIQKATNDWQMFSTLTENVQSAQASGNPQAAQQAQRQLDDWMINNQKSLKNMSKVFQQDWLSPEKTTVWHAGYNRMLEQKQKKDAAHKFAIGKIAEFFRGQGQPQLSPAEQQGMVHEIQQKTPMSMQESPEMEKNVLDLLGKQIWTPAQEIELQKMIQDGNYRDAQIALQTKKMDLDDKRLQLTLQQGQQRIDQGEERIKSEKQYQQQEAELRSQELQLRRMELSQKLSPENTPQARTQNYNAVLADLKQQRQEAASALSKSNSSMLDKVTGARKTNQQNYDDINKRIQAVQKAQSDYKSGKIDYNALTDLAFGSGRPSGTSQPQAPKGQPVYQGGKLIGYTTDGKTMVPANK